MLAGATVESKKNQARISSWLKFDLDDDQATKWLVAYMKWFLYANDLEATNNN